MRPFVQALCLPLTFLFLAPFPASCGSNAPSPTAPTDSVQTERSPTREVSFVITGDIMQHDSQIAGALQPDGRYNYAPSFDSIAPFLKAADFTIGNLELTLAGKPYKGYPSFSAPDMLAWDLKKAGFNVLTTANNHSCDRREKGIARTIRMLDSAGIPHVGTYLNQQQRDSLNPLILRKDTIKIALLAYTYGTNGIPFRAPYIVDLIDTVQMAKDLAKAREKAHATIVAMHWGEEYRDHPSAAQLRLANFLLREGVAVVIGNHPHVIQPIMLRQDCAGAGRQLVFFSLGNFISGQRTFPRAGAMLARFNLRFAPNGVTITHPQYLLTYVERLRKGGRRFPVVRPITAPPDSSFTKDDPTYPLRYVEHAAWVLKGAEGAVNALHLSPADSVGQNPWGTPFTPRGHMPPIPIINRVKPLVDRPLDGIQIVSPLP